MASPKAEDYLEAIRSLMQRKGYVRVKDLAGELGVKPPTVTGMLSRLGGKGYVHYEKRGGISLTQKGRKTASEVAARHEVLSRLLKALGVPAEIAEEDACAMEHSLNPKTMRRLSLLVGFMEGDSGFSEAFRKYSVKK